MRGTRRPTDEQFAGCLVGIALGDALGFGVEGASPDEARAYAEEAILRRPDRLRGRGTFAFGQVSDDTQLARELARSLVASPPFSPEDYARRIAQLFTHGKVVGYGQSTAQAARRLALGVPWDRAGTPPPAAGNGSAMRAAPVGLAFYADPEGLVRVALAQGRITHADPRCGAGSVAIAGATALALVEERIEVASFVARLGGWVRQADAGFAQELDRLAEWVALPPEEARPLVAAAGGEAGGGGISGYVVPSVLWALYSFLRHPGDYLAAVATAVAGGGDTDTTAAMAGGIAGAQVGLDGLPADLCRHVNDRGRWTAAELAELGRRLWRAYA